MDSLVQEKSRKEKLYNSKLSRHMKKLKEHSSVPQINPLSRKVAELVTLKELQSLGIEAYEPPSKKTYYNLSTFAAALNSRRKQSEDLTSQITPKNTSQKVTIPGLSPIVQVETEAKDSLFLESTEKILEIPQNFEKNTENYLETLKNESNVGEKSLETSLKQLESINHFKQELQKDYPELPLHSGEVSSFNTMELKELDEATKDLVVPQAQPAPCVVSLPEVKTELDPVQLEKNPLKPTPEIFGRSSQTRQRCSKYQSFHSESKDFSNLQSSYLKASFLHSTQEPVSREVPRCHLNLSTSEVSPIYFSYRIGKDFKVKTDNGLGPVDSLRRIILEPDSLEKPSEKSDIYSRNLKWMIEKRQLHQNLRNSLDIENMKLCTFDPFLSKKAKPEEDSLFFTKSVSNRLEKKDFEVIKPTSTIQYTGLSPFDGKLAYQSLCSSEKFLAKARPLVNYKQVNLLK
jgi:hypothetical protein